MSSPIQQIALLLKAGSNRRMLHQFLQDLGHEVVVSNGIEDLYQLEEQDLVIVDESLVSGCKESLGELKRRRHLLPVLLVARHASPAAVAFLRQGFIDDILYMPTSKPELATRVNVLLRLSSQSRTALQKFERLFEDASWGIAILHPEAFTIEASNQAFARMHGLSSADLDRRDFRLLVEPDVLGQLDRDLSRLRQRQSLIFQTCFLSSQGHGSFPVEIDATFYRDGFGVPLYIAIYVRDITERLHAENALKKKNLELEEATSQAKQASRAKSHFLANINHELRTPLHGVLAPLSLLSNTPLTEEQSGHVRLIQQSADDLFRLVGDILDFTTLGSGELELERVPVCLPVLAELVLEGMQSQAKIKGLSLTLSLNNPPSEELLFDPVRIRQVLQHLLSNAIKFTQSGSIEVALDFLSRPQCLRCEVRDSGIGIDPQKQEAIFEFFTQADASTTRPFDGVGLGLSLSIQLVRLMGGTLGMRSQLGRGSTFFFEIPAEVVTSPAPVDGEELATGTLSVLVVEDNPVNQQVMRLLLTELGHSAVIASGGQEGMSRFERETFDLVLMDLQMPDMSGFEAARLVREWEQSTGRSRTPIVAITAGVLFNGKEECSQAGMDKYLTKPVSLHQLRKLMGELFFASKGRILPGRFNLENA